MIQGPKASGMKFMDTKNRFVERTPINVECGRKKVKKYNLAGTWADRTFGV
jgi:hypothetical protein